MRTLTLALVAGLALPVASGVQAADLDYGVLRGPDYETEVAVIDWSGVYVGAHAGYNSASADFKGVFSSLVLVETRNTIAERSLGASNLLAPRSANLQVGSFGGFAGYNVQIDETVLGIEVDYTSFGKSLSTFDSVGRFVRDSTGYLNTARLSGSAKREVEDYGTIRVRGGYAIGSFLPFVTAGVALGRINATDEVSVQTYGYDQVAYNNNLTLPANQRTLVGNYGYTSFDSANPDASTPAPARIVRANRNKVMGGITLGAGLEFALTSNIILRAEYQYVMLNDFAANRKKDPDNNQVTTYGALGATSINTVRAGAAIKF
jgi:opacity protein-like surface antigen